MTTNGRPGPSPPATEPIGPLIVVTASTLAATAAAWIIGRIAATVDARGRCSIALSGGHTPRDVYRCLAARAGDVRWDRVDVYFGDERCVAPDDPSSNYRMATESLLSHVPIPAARIFRMPGERADAEIAAREYDVLLPESIDLLLLGIGTDGHTASLFPGSPALDEIERRVMPTMSPAIPHERMTITPPVIACARSIAVIAAGSGKADAVREAREGLADWHATPAQLARRGTWIVDRDAASALRARR